MNFHDKDLERQGSTSRQSTLPGVLAVFMCGACLWLAACAPTSEPLTNIPPPTWTSQPKGVVQVPTPILPVPSAVPSPTDLPADNRKFEFIAEGQIACGGGDPIPGCGYILQEWVGASGPVAPGETIKVLVMDPRTVDLQNIDSCQGYEVQDGAYDWSDKLIRVRVRGEPCDWDPGYLFCVCDSLDFIRLEPVD